MKLSLLSLLAGLETSGSRAEEAGDVSVVLDELAEHSALDELAEEVAARLLFTAAAGAAAPAEENPIASSASSPTAGPIALQPNTLQPASSEDTLRLLKQQECEQLKQDLIHAVFQTALETTAKAVRNQRNLGDDPAFLRQLEESSDEEVTRLLALQEEVTRLRALRGPMEAARNAVEATERKYQNCLHELQEMEKLGCPGVARLAERSDWCRLTLKQRGLRDLEMWVPRRVRDLLQPQPNDPDTGGSFRVGVGRFILPFVDPALAARLDPATDPLQWATTEGALVEELKLSEQTKAVCKYLSEKRTLYAQMQADQTGDDKEGEEQLAIMQAAWRALTDADRSDLTRLVCEEPHACGNCILRTLLDEREPQLQHTQVSEDPGTGAVTLVLPGPFGTHGDDTLARLPPCDCTEPQRPRSPDGVARPRAAFLSSASGARSGPPA